MGVRCSAGRHSTRHDNPTRTPLNLQRCEPRLTQIGIVHSHSKTAAQRHTHQIKYDPQRTVTMASLSTPRTARGGGGATSSAALTAASNASSGHLSGAASATLGGSGATARIELSRGRSYIGSLNARRKPEGSGTKFDKNGRIIAQCDAWKDGKTLDTGGRFSGGFRHGAWHGLGIFLGEDGSQFEGSWVGGAQHGPGKLTTAGGDVVEGCWLDNVQTGYGASWNREGKLLHMGRYENGPRQVCPIPRSALPAATHLNKQERGASILYPDGRYYIGAFSDNLPHGEGRLYNSAHQLLHAGYFHNGVFAPDHVPEAARAAESAAAAAAAANATGALDAGAAAQDEALYDGVPLHLIEPAGPAALLSRLHDPPLSARQPRP